MSNKKGMAKREAYAKKQEEQGKSVIKWIAIGLIVLAVIYYVWTLNIIS